MSLFEDRIEFKPFRYDWAYRAWEQQQRIHWLPEEVPMADDVKDWKFKLTDAEKNLLTNILRLFVQSDVEVSKSYHTVYQSRFKPIEIQMMLAAFQNMETIHVAAYAHLIDTLGLPETEYAAFLDYSEMKEKWEAWGNFFHPKTNEDLAVSMSVFGAFTEGLQLFASFAMLLNFPRHNKLKGLGQIISWSVRDESLHSESIIKLFHELLKERPEIDTPALRARIEHECREAVRHEDAFIDKAFEMGEVKGMTADDVKQYIRYIADRRMIQLGYKGIFKVKKNPLPWLDEMLNAVEHANFFEQRATEYSKAATKGTWDEVFDEVDDGESPDRWVVYSKSGCPGCVAAKQMLKQKGIEWDEVNLDDDDARKAFYESVGEGVRTVPQVFHNDKRVGGSEALRAYLSAL